MAEYTISAKLHATFAMLRDALATLAPTVAEHHDIDFAWRSVSMDINIAAVAPLPPDKPMDYLVTGWMSGAMDDVIANCTRLARALENAAIPFQLEVEDETTGEEICVLRHGSVRIGSSNT